MDDLLHLMPGGKGRATAAGAVLAPGTAIGGADFLRVFDLGRGAAAQTIAPPPDAGHPVATESPMRITGNGMAMDDGAKNSGQTDNGSPLADLGAMSSMTATLQGGAMAIDAVAISTPPVAAPMAPNADSTENRAAITHPEPGLGAMGASSSTPLWPDVAPWGSGVGPITPIAASLSPATGAMLNGPDLQTAPVHVAATALPGTGANPKGAAHAEDMSDPGDGTAPTAIHIGQAMPLVGSAAVDMATQSKAVTEHARPKNATGNPAPTHALPDAGPARMVFADQTPERPAPSTVIDPALPSEQAAPVPGKMMRQLPAFLLNDGDRALPRTALSPMARAGVPMGAVSDPESDTPPVKSDVTLTPDARPMIADTALSSRSTLTPTLAMSPPRPADMVLSAGEAVAALAAAPDQGTSVSTKAGLWSQTAELPVQPSRDSAGPGRIFLHAPPVESPGRSVLTTPSQAGQAASSTTPPLMAGLDAPLVPDPPTPVQMARPGNPIGPESGPESQFAMRPAANPQQMASPSVPAAGQMAPPQDQTDAPWRTVPVPDGAPRPALAEPHIPVQSLTTHVSKPGPDRYSNAAQKLPDTTSTAPRPVAPMQTLVTGPAPASSAALPGMAGTAPDPMSGLSFPLAAQDVAPLIQPGAPASTGAPAPPAAPHAVPVAQQIAAALQDRAPDRTAPLDLALDPPELGRVRLSVVEVAGTLTLSITAERAETADLMRRHMNLLADELGRAGVDAPGVNISHGDGGGQRSRGHADQNTGDAPTEPVAPRPPNDPMPAARLAVDSGLDLRL